MVKRMTISRRKLIEPQITPFYHVINRCVRRAYLCGDDPYNGKNYQHRRGWIVNIIKRKLPLNHPHQTKVISKDRKSVV